MDKVTTTKVQLGHLEVDGYLMYDGTFAMSLTQVGEWMLGSDYDRSQLAKRYVEICKSSTAQTLIPQGTVIHRNIKVVNTNYKVHLVPLNQVIPILTVAIALGHRNPMQIVAILGSLTLQQLFCDAFEIKFDKADRQTWLTVRMEGIIARNSLTDAIGDYLSVYKDKLSINEHKFIYVHCTNAIYKLMFNKDAKQLRVIYNCDNPRDKIETEKLRDIEYIERTAASILNISAGKLKPLEAVQKACMLAESVGLIK